MEAISTKVEKHRSRPSDSEAKGWFLTYPKCPLTPHDVLLHLRALHNPAIVEYVIATESHADGTPHVHAFVQYSTKIVFGAHRWDIDGYHGNYQKARSWRCCEVYIKKDKAPGIPKVSGVDYISSLDINAAQHKKAARNLQLISEDPVKLVESGIIGLLQLPQLLQSCKLLRELQDKVPSPCVGFIPNDFDIELPLRQVKLRHYWLWSDLPNTGKTTFMVQLGCPKKHGHSTYFYSQAEKYQDLLRPGTQFLLFDEYTSPTMTLTQMNAICDGTYKHPRKGTTPVTLDNPIVIVGANKPPEEVYTSETSWPLLRARFNVIRLTKQFVVDDS